MALTILSNLSYNGKNPNFERDRVATLKALRDVKHENQEYDYGHIVFCEEDGKHYRFMYNYDEPDKANYNDTTGWFKEFATAEGGSVDLSEYVKESELADVALSGRYDDLSGLPTIPNEAKVSFWGFTKNKGTVTGVKINGNAGPIDTNGVVDLGYIDSGGGDTIINGVTDVTVGGASVVSNNKATIPNASTSAYGVTKLTDAIDKDDSSLAATAKAVSIINANKQDKISDLETIRTDSQNAFKGTINGETTGDLDVVTSVNGVSPNRGAVTIDVGDKNVQSDWNATSGDAFIKNKPTIPTTLDQLTQSASYRTVTDTEKNTWDAKLDKDTADNSYLGKNDKAASAATADTATKAIQDGDGNVISKTYATEEYVDTEVTTLWEALEQKQDKLDDNNIKTINNESILGKGNIEIFAGEVNVQSDWAVTSPTDDAYIKNKPTFKTINGESILGTGNIEVGGGTPAYPLVNHGTGSTTYTLTPNTFHVWGIVTSLTLTLGATTDGIANEYLFQFSTDSSTPTALSLPSYVIWAGGEVPQIEVMKTYQVSILNNCATMLSFG